MRAVVQVPAFVGRSSAEILNRLSDLPDQVADRVVNAWRQAQAAVADPDGGVTVAGRPLAEVTDPFTLEVHRPVQPEDAPPGLPLLPPYVPREHDEVLGQVVAAAAGGRSGIAVLVGGSSTGKTRACWEALALLRDQDPPWRLWHPIDPSRLDAALRPVRLIARAVQPEDEAWVAWPERPAELRAVADVAAARQQAAPQPQLAPLPGGQGFGTSPAAAVSSSASAQPSAAALAVPAAACGRTAKAASPIRQIRPNAIRATSMS